MGEIGWYGQSTPAEDRIAAALFGDFVGTYCEVGAFNGIDLSNTYHFYLKGWKGINFEPHPENYELLDMNQPNAINLNYAIGAHQNLNDTMYTAPGKPIVTGFNLPEWYVKSEAPNGLVPLEVVQTTLTTALSAAKIDTLDYLSIDTDGTELDVLQGMDFSRWQPRLIILEYNHALRVIDDHLRNAGYVRAHENGLNAFYVRSADDYNTIREAANDC